MIVLVLFVGFVVIGILFVFGKRKRKKATTTTTSSAIGTNDNLLRGAPLDGSLANGLRPIPDECVPYKRLPGFTDQGKEKYFTAETIPKGLLQRHNTKKGVWGKLIVTKGKLLYRLLEPTEREFSLDPKVYAVVEPQVWHEVFPETEDVEFFIVFHNKP
mmetsp:Transcript_43964/g.61787  ORF Transcript_43964/g.61787 Transcript_43964/m.61787 type:complete len:159 (-) Transcript_43964:59-535(-)